MDISFDPIKRSWTLENRGLDFADAGLLFAGRQITIQDTREDYGEDRFITAGFFVGRFVVIVWTPRGTARRIISMRHGHDEERILWEARGL